MENILKESKGRQIVTGFFNSPAGGEKIYYRRSHPHESAEGHKHLVIVPNIGEYHCRHLPLAEFLEKKMGNQISFSWIDHKGHGLSGGTRGHVESFEEYCFDLLELMKRLPPQDDYHLLGHGVGGLVVLKTLLEFSNRIPLSIGGLILSNPAIKMKFDLPQIFSKKIRGPLGNGLRKMKIPFRIDGYDLTHDKMAAEEFNRDPLNNHSISSNLYREIIVASKEVRVSSYYLDYPTLFVTGEEDVFFDHNYTELFKKGMKKSQMSHRSYKKLKNDLFNDFERDKVFRDIYNWISESHIE